MTGRRLGVREVPPAEVSEGARVAALDALGAVSRDLGLPAPFLRWFALAPGEPWRPSADDLALASLGAFPRADLYGHANAAVTPPVVWLRSDLPAHVAVVIAAHEARHIWQSLNWNPDDEARFEQAEEDADAYALRAPWPKRFSGDVEREPMLDASRARAKALGVPVTELLG